MSLFEKGAGQARNPFFPLTMHTELNSTAQVFPDSPRLDVWFFNFPMQQVKCAQQELHFGWDFGPFPGLSFRCRVQQTGRAAAHCQPCHAKRSPTPNSELCRLCFLVCLVCEMYFQRWQWAYWNPPKWRSRDTHTCLARTPAASRGHLCWSKHLHQEFHQDSARIVPWCSCLVAPNAHFLFRASVSILILFRFFLT